VRSVGHRKKGMRRRTRLALDAGVLLVSIALGLTACALRAKAPKAEKGPEWNEPQAEKTEALRLTGDPQRGQRLYETCASCHLPSGAGQSNGTMPQLAGQHPTVLIKQLAEIRSGLRVSSVMLPYATQLKRPQDLTDVAAYIAALPIPADHSTGPGVDLDRGEALYARDCARCHGHQGEGAATTFIPMIVGQHYQYVVRQLIDIASERRGNAHPDMARIVETYSARDVSLVADYVSRLSGTP
jgi:cytochrome c553